METSQRLRKANRGSREEPMSEWLNLVKGVDSEERLLSITWDTLQRNKILCVIEGFRDAQGPRLLSS